VTHEPGWKQTLSRWLLFPPNVAFLSSLMIRVVSHKLVFALIGAPVPIPLFRFMVVCLAMAVAYAGILGMVRNRGMQIVVVILLGTGIGELSDFMSAQRFGGVSPDVLGLGLATWLVAMAGGALVTHWVTTRRGSYQ
jgi:hypothetical protein